MKLSEDFRRFCLAQTRERGNCEGCPLVRNIADGDIACYPNSKAAKKIVAQWIKEQEGGNHEQDNADPVAAEQLD